MSLVRSKAVVLNGGRRILHNAKTVLVAVPQGKLGVVVPLGGGRSEQSEGHRWIALCACSRKQAFSKLALSNPVPSGALEIINRGNVVARDTRPSQKTAPEEALCIRVSTVGSGLNQRYRFRNVGPEQMHSISVLGFWVTSGRRQAELCDP
jgi:hypothetical protein